IQIQRLQETITSEANESKLKEWFLLISHENNISDELHIKRETIKRYEQELQSMKHLFEITIKEKQIGNDQLQHERQSFQTGNNALTQLVIRDGHEKLHHLNQNDMKSLLIFGRKVIVKHDDVVPERSKSQYSRNERAADIDTEQH
ncbi:unnamed protein product, partial [Adineta steineri]